LPRSNKTCADLGEWAAYVYDGDGVRVKATVNGVTTVCIGNYYEQTGSTIRKYYYHAGKRVAMRDGSTLYWLLTDHLGSTAIAATSTGVLSGELRYKAWGETRYTTGTVASKYRFTGQREESTIGLYFYNARWYDAALGRFVQADTVVPEVGNPQSLNRYAYVYNNPLRYTDPSGRAAAIDEYANLLSNPVTGRPFLRNVPPVIAYIYKEMIRNAQSLTAQVIRAANEAVAVELVRGHVCNAVMAKTVAIAIWTSQVMDARVKDYAGPIAPLLGNWDHKPTLYPQGAGQQPVVPEIPARGGWSLVGARLLRYDIWSNIHYGYVGRASGFSQPELTGGAGIEQIGSNWLSGASPHFSQGADNWAASWDDPSDNAAIQIGIHLWNEHSLAVKPSDLYLAVLEEPRLANKPLVGAP